MSRESPARSGALGLAATVGAIPSTPPPCRRARRRPRHRRRNTPTARQLPDRVQRAPQTAAPTPWPPGDTTTRPGADRPATGSIDRQLSRDQQLSRSRDQGLELRPRPVNLLRLLLRDTAAFLRLESALQRHRHEPSSGPPRADSRARGGVRSPAVGQYLSAAGIHLASRSRGRRLERREADRAVHRRDFNPGRLQIITVEDGDVAPSTSKSNAFVPEEVAVWGTFL